MKYLLTVLMLLALSLGATGCGTINGFASDVENGARWMREVTQKNVDNTELRRIRSSIDTQSRIIKRGDQLTKAVK